MLSRRKKKNQNKRLLLVLWSLIILVLLIIFVKRLTNSSWSDIQTGAVLSGDIQSGVAELSPLEEAILNDLPLTWITDSQTTAWEVAINSERLVENTALSTGSQTTTIQTNSASTTGEKKNQNSDLFPVALCNNIVSLYQCIIEQAPIENQALMQEKLKKSTAQRALLASPQLSEICQKISQDPTFILVKNHYGTWDFNCTF